MNLRHTGIATRARERVASGADAAQAISGACDTIPKELIQVMKKIVSVVERMLGGESGWKWT